MNTVLVVYSSYTRATQIEWSGQRRNAKRGKKKNKQRKKNG